MKTIITTCCPYTNLEEVLLVLHQAGLKVVDDAFVRWHDKLFGPSDTVDPLQIDHDLLHGSILEEDITSILPEAETGPLLLADSRCLWFLDFWATKLPEAKFLLFYTSAESAVASACLQEIEPQQALETWQAASRQLLNFQRRNRRRALLLDMDAAIRQPQALIDICRAYWTHPGVFATKECTGSRPKHSRAIFSATSSCEPAGSAVLANRVGGKCPTFGQHCASGVSTSRAFKKT